MLHTTLTDRLNAQRNQKRLNLVFLKCLNSEIKINKKYVLKSHTNVPRIVHMYTLKTFITSLKLHGSKNTLKLAEAHNLRKIDAEFRTCNHIDEFETPKNIELISLGTQSLEERVLYEISKAGIDMTTRHNKRHDKGYALEVVYSPSPGWDGASESLFRDCCKWQANFYRGCPIVHAVIHYDEGTPHLHTVMVPIVGNRLPAADLKGYKGVSTERNRDLFNKVAHKYGFTSSESLKGSIKKKAAQKVIEKCSQISPEEFKATLWTSIKQAIESRPEPFMSNLDISLNDVLKKGYLIPV